MQIATDFYTRKILRCPCLLQVIGRIFGLRSLKQILLYLQELEDFLVEKIYCARINKKKIYW